MRSGAPVTGVVVVLMGAALAACSHPAPAAVTTASPTPSSSPTPLPDMWSLHADPGRHYSVATPNAWDIVLRDSRTFSADIESIGKHSRELLTFFQKAMAVNSDLRLLAADPRSLAEGFAANIAVLSSDLGAQADAPTLAELADAKLTRLNQEAAVKQPVKVVPDHLGGRPAMRFDYKLKAGDQDVTIRSYIAVVDHGGRRTRFDLTMGAPGDQATTIFDTAAQSFGITGL